MIEEQEKKAVAIPIEEAESSMVIVKGVDKIMPDLIKTQKEVGKISFDRENPFASSKYATLDAIINEIEPKLNENNIFLSQIPINKTVNGKEYVGIETHFIHASGQQIWYKPFFLVVEKGSKMNLAQSQGSIVTYAKRYTLSAIFGVATGEDTDGVVGENGKVDNSHHVQQHHQQQQQPNNQQANEDFGMHKGALLNRINAVANKTQTSNDDLYAWLIRGINEQTGGNEQDLTPQNIRIAITLVGAMEKKAGINNG